MSEETTQSGPWRDASVELPELNTRVIVFGDGKIHDCAVLRDGSVWTNDNWPLDVPVTDGFVTHWMPLPAAPGTEERT